MSAPDQTNVEVPDGHLRGLIEAALMAYSETQPDQETRMAKMIAPISEMAELLERRSVTTQASEGAVDDLRPLVRLAPASDKPEWEQVNDLFERHGLASPDWRLRDELVSWLLWARFGEAIATPNQSKRVERLEAALKPLLDHFAWFIDDPSFDPADSIDEGTNVTVGQIRAARQALKESPHD